MIEKTESYYRNINDPLKIEVVEGRLVISIGVDTLAFAITHRNESCSFSVNDNNEFAKDVVRELKDEEEDGATIVSDLLDEASNRAIDNGSAYIDDIMRGI